jgi:hypothetical protein
MKSPQYLVYFLDPLKNSTYTNHYKFFTKEDAEIFIIESIEYHLNLQVKFVSGLKGNLEKHLENYKKYLKKNNEIYFFGEYNEICNNSEYVYKYWIEKI